MLEALATHSGPRLFAAQDLWRVEEGDLVCQTLLKKGGINLAPALYQETGDGFLVEAL